jgi:hypothetical protein
MAHFFLQTFLQYSVPQEGVSVTQGVNVHEHSGVLPYEFLQLSCRHAKRFEKRIKLEEDQGSIKL